MHGVPTDLYICGCAVRDREIVNFRQLSSVDIDILSAYVMHFIAPCPRPRLHSLWKSVIYVDFGYRTFSVVIRFGVKNTRTFRDVNGTSHFGT